ncbi:uncharacterized protein LOC123882470 [Trifolium pratense]|uniref:uncharacterized protein LOC123882470 n=1 Tax=Trifolium pratense TaxID=57577 RepID=UPI001E6975C4|nr:uncharacterized protein LOC123882470 [Trifolium pratense]
MINDGVNHLSIDKSFRIKQDDKFFSRLKSKEASSANTSSRIMYYGETSIAIPFVWEAQPGTPKHPLSETSIPPLTPPPSYFSKKSKTNKKRKPKINIFSCIFPKLVDSRKTTHPSSTSSLSTSSSSSSSSTYSYSMRDNNHGSFSSSCSSTNVRGANKGRGCYPIGKIIKNVSVDHGAG